MQSHRSGGKNYALLISNTFLQLEIACFSNLSLLIFFQTKLINSKELSCKKRFESIFQGISAHNFRYINNGTKKPRYFSAICSNLVIFIIKNLAFIYDSDVSCSLAFTLLSPHPLLS